jgi:ABC-type transport system involved in cytochrome c biogenesis permease subunit
VFASAETERLLLLTAVLTFGIASVVAILVSRSPGRKALILPATLGAASLLVVAAITVRWIRESQGPFLTLYDVLLSNLFTLALIYLVAYVLDSAVRAAAVLIMPFLLLLGIWLLLVPADAIPLPATYENYWLWLHVISGKLFFGLCLTAAGTASLLVFRSARDSGTTLTPAPSTRRADMSIWRLMSMAFVCDSFMLIAGAVWAHSAWGRYWAWDPLETWALLTWLALALLLHSRVTFKRLPDLVFWIGVLLVFALAFLTFLGVPFVSTAPHKGVM